MSDNYIIVLFKNKKKRKIIKRYATEKKAYLKFNDIIEKQKSIIFEKLVENYEEISYSLGLLTNQTKIQKSLFITDDLGRNIPAQLENSEYVFLDLKRFKKEEKIYDWQLDKKITVDYFLKKYCGDKNLKSIFTLNNKICVQNEENLNLFSLKDTNESIRFLDVIESYFFENGRTDAFFVRDVSTSQRKWLYNLLVEKGFDKKRLYRLKTTFSKR
jgi:hypothetical protein